MISSEAQSVINQFIELDVAEKMITTPLEESRKGWEEQAALIPLPEGTTYHEVNAGGVKAEFVKAPNARADQIVLYFHGGGYSSGSPTTHRNLAAHLSAGSGREVLLVDYRLAPEHPFPAAIDDGYSVYNWLLDRGFKGKDVVIGGDSAGGGLTMALSYRLRESGKELPKALFLLSPWLDLTASGESHTTKVEVDPMIRLGSLINAREWYCNEEQFENPLVSPVFGELNGLPPIYIQVGSDEILLSDSEMLAKKAKAAGVDVTYEEWKGLWHVWHLSAGFVPEAGDALAKVGTYIDKHLS